MKMGAKLYSRMKRTNERTERRKKIVDERGGGVLGLFKVHYILV